MSRAQLTSTVEQNTGGAVSPYVAGKNKIINGDMGIWQRGTSISYTGSASLSYSADRFYHYSNGNGAWTFSQQVLTPGSITGYDSPYFARASLPSAGTTTALNWGQRIENVQTLANQTVTISFWAKTDSARSLNWTFEQNFGSGGSSTVATASSNFNVSTSWTRYSIVVTLPSISGKTVGASSFLGVYVNGGAVTSGFVLDLWGVQVEAGSVATPFTTATGTLSGELAACRRYLPAFAGPSGAYIGYAYASNAAIYTIPFDVPARVAPTGITVAGTINALALNTQYSVTPTFDSAGATEGCLGVSSGLTITAGQGSRLNLSTSALILFTGCEL